MYLKKQDESGLHKIIWEGDPLGFILRANSEQVSLFPLLRGVALYEDTYFNSQQVKMLINELDSLGSLLLDTKAEEDLNSLIDFAKTVDLQEHLVFVGD